MSGAPRVERLGRRAFADVHDAMRALATEVQAGRDDGAIWLVEHDPVYTAGRATPPAELGPGIVPIERGGRVTYHGPGQLVVYPILRLARRDARAWLRGLEAFGVSVCAELGLSATASEDGTGVFVDGRKVASIGVAIRRWVNLHGIAINVAMDLAAFAAIRPCGLDPSRMDDLSGRLGRRVPMREAEQAAEDRVALLLEACSDGR